MTAARWLAAALHRPLRVGDELTAADAIVVLGAPLGRDDRPGPALRERIASAADLYARGAAARVVATGGLTRGARRTEAAVMAEELLALGVPGDAILREERARTTAENATFVAALLPSAAAVWLVTQPFHARRARWLFRRAGLAPRVWHIADSIQYQEPARALRWLAREYAAWGRALVTRGR